MTEIVCFPGFFCACQIFLLSVKKWCFIVVCKTCETCCQGEHDLKKNIWGVRNGEVLGY
jgi:hypothetical protein